MRHTPDVSDEIRPMDEDEINRQVLKMSSQEVDVHNTGTFLLCVSCMRIRPRCQ